MNLLKYFQKPTLVTKPLLYVASGLEYANNLEWREWLQQELKYKYDVILPDIVPNPHQKTDLAYAEWYFENYIEPDIKYICNCGQFFVFIDHSFLNGSGAKSEVTLATVLGKPITYYLHHVELADLPGWTIGCLVKAKRVNDLKEAVNHYRSL